MTWHVALISLGVAVSEGGAGNGGEIEEGVVVGGEAILKVKIQKGSAILHPLE